MAAKRLVLSGAVVLLLAAIVPAFGGGQKEPAAATASVKPITFKYLRGAWPTWDEPMTADPMGKWLIEKTGVTLQAEIISGDAKQKYNLLLAAKDYPDLMGYPGDDMVAKFAEAGALVQLDKYLDRYPDIRQQFQEAWGVFTSLDDGHIYALPTWYNGKFIASIGTDIRHDVMKQYFPDRADVKAVFTLDEIYKMLTDYKSKNPKTPGGKAFIGWTNTPGQLMAMRQIWNNSQRFYSPDGKTVSMYMFNPHEIDTIRFLNKMYNGGTLDPDMFLNTNDQANTKLANGSCIIVNFHQATYSPVNAEMYNSDNNKYMAYYRVVAYKDEPNGYYAHSPYGGAGTVVMTACKDLPRLLSFINYTCDKYVNFYLCNGLPGTFYDVVGNKVVVKEDALKATSDLWARFRMVGGYKYVGWLREGIDTRLGSFWKENVPVGSLIHYSWDAALDYSQNHRYFNWVDRSEFTDPGYNMGIAVSSDSTEGIIATKIDDIYNNAFAKAVMAANEGEAVSIYNKAIADIRAAGYDNYMKVMTPRYLSRKKYIDESRLIK